MFIISLIINILATLGFLVYWLIVFIILYHLSRFGVGTQPKKFAAGLLFGSVILSGITIVLFVSVDFPTLLSELMSQTQ